MRDALLAGDDDVESYTTRDQLDGRSGTMDSYATDGSMLGAREDEEDEEQRWRLTSIRRHGHSFASNATHLVLQTEEQLASAVARWATRFKLFSILQCCVTLPFFLNRVWFASFLDLVGGLVGFWGSFKEKPELILTSCIALVVGFVKNIGLLHFLIHTTVVITKDPLPTQVRNFDWTSPTGISGITAMVENLLFVPVGLFLGFKLIKALEALGLVASLRTRKQQESIIRRTGSSFAEDDRLQPSLIISTPGMHQPGTGSALLDDDDLDVDR